MRRFAFIGAVLAGAMNGGCGAPPEERAISTFTDGDLKTALVEQANIRDGTPHSDVARYLVGVSRYLVGDSTPREIGITVADAAGLFPQVEQLAEKSPHSPWLHFAAAVLAHEVGNTDSAGRHLQSANQRSTDSVELRAALGVASALVSRADLETTVAGSVEGVLKPVAGPIGYLLPLEGETVVRGEVRSSVGGVAFKATVDHWAYLYCSSPQGQPCGWGLRARSGEVLLTRTAYDAMTRRHLPVSADQGFHARAWDPFGRFVLLGFQSEHQGLVLPVQIKWPDDARKEIRDAVPTPDVAFDGNMYWADSYTGSRLGGIMFDERGRRVLFNTDGLRVKLEKPSEIRGPVYLVGQRGEPPNQAAATSR